MARHSSIKQLREQIGTFKEPINKESPLEPQFSSGLFDQDPDEKSVLASCHKLLANKLVTEQELRKRLTKEEYDPKLVDFALERCISAGLIDDASYAKSWVESRVRRGHGPMRIRQDLTQRGIARELIEAELEIALENESINTGAADALRRKAARADMSDRKVEQKLRRWLAGRGYSYAQIDHAWRLICAEKSDV